MAKKKWKGGRKNFRAHKWRKQGRACAYCKREIPLSDATFDHVFARSKSQHENPDRNDNLIIACFFCNNLRGDTPFPEFLKIIDKLRKEDKLGPTRHLDKTRLKKTKGLLRRLSGMRYRPFKPR